VSEQKKKKKKGQQQTPGRLDAFCDPDGGNLGFVLTLFVPRLSMTRPQFIT